MIPTRSSRLAFCPGVLAPVAMLLASCASPLAGWRVAEELDFSDHGTVEVAGNEVILGAGTPMTGIVRTEQVPRESYEVRLEAKRLEGGDFFCGLTFPVGESHCTLIVGGWGGGIVGLSNIDDMSAVENETTKPMDFEDDRWYAVRLRVTPAKVEAWIDGDRVVSVEREGRRFSIWPQQDAMRPLGIATYYTRAALRGFAIEPVATP